MGQLFTQTYINQITSWLVHNWSTFGAWTSHEQTWIHKTHHNVNLGEANVMHSQVLRWTHWRVHQSVVTESWDLEGALDFQHYRGVKGRARSPGIRLGRRIRGSSLNLHPKQTTKWLIHIPGHPSVLGQATCTLDHKTHHSPDSGEATTFPHILFSTTLHGGYIQMALFPGTPKLESRNYPEIVPGEVPELWELITPDCKV